MPMSSMRMTGSPSARRSAARLLGRLRRSVHRVQPGPQRRPSARPGGPQRAQHHADRARGVRRDRTRRRLRGGGGLSLPHGFGHRPQVLDLRVVAEARQAGAPVRPVATRPPRRLPRWSRPGPRAPTGDAFEPSALVPGEPAARPAGRTSSPTAQPPRPGTSIVITLTRMTRIMPM